MKRLLLLAAMLTLFTCDAIWVCAQKAAVPKAGVPTLKAPMAVSKKVEAYLMLVHYHAHKASPRPTPIPYMEKMLAKVRAGLERLNLPGVTTDPASMAKLREGFNKKETDNAREYLESLATYYEGYSATIKRGLALTPRPEEARPLIAWVDGMSKFIRGELELLGGDADSPGTDSRDRPKPRITASSKRGKDETPEDWESFEDIKGLDDLPLDLPENVTFAKAKWAVDNVPPDAQYELAPNGDMWVVLSDDPKFGHFRADGTLTEAGLFALRHELEHAFLDSADGTADRVANEKDKDGNLKAIPRAINEARAYEAASKFGREIVRAQRKSVTGQILSLFSDEKHPYDSARLTDLSFESSIMARRYRELQKHLDKQNYDKARAFAAEQGGATKKHMDGIIDANLPAK